MCLIVVCCFGLYNCLVTALNKLTVYGGVYIRPTVRNCVCYVMFI